MVELFLFVYIINHRGTKVLSYHIEIIPSKAHPGNYVALALKVSLVIVFTFYLKKTVLEII